MTENNPFLRDRPLLGERLRSHMLVLTRRAGEAIVLELPDGRTMEFVIQGTDGGQVKVGIQADKDIIVTRKELLEEGKKPRDVNKPHEDFIPLDEPLSPLAPPRARAIRARELKRVSQS